jgi:hypothetical protein
MKHYIQNKMEANFMPSNTITFERLQLLCFQALGPFYEKCGIIQILKM